jgi:hypothetical protein
MPARFDCEATFTIRARRCFVLCGQIIEGIVRPGMLVKIQMPSGNELVRPIHSLERISTSDKRGRVGLLIKCEDQEELENLQRIGIRDVICPIAEPLQR